MAVTRRQLLAGTGAAAGAHVLLPAVIRAGAAFGAAGVDPATRNRNRVLVVFLSGGNDGLNTVVPTGDVHGAARYSVYRKVRPALRYDPAKLLRLDRHGDADEKLGLNPKLKTVHRFYRESRLAIVQGVDYPNHSYSHFDSADIWHSGEPGRMPDSGWMGRHLDRAGVGEGELRGLGIGTTIPLMLMGRSSSGVQLTHLQAARFIDGFNGMADPRHQALAGYARHPASEPVRAYVGRDARTTNEMVEKLRHIKVNHDIQNRLAKHMLSVRTLFDQNLGVECAFVQQHGYDTHTGQRSQHEQLLTELDTALEAFYFGTIAGKPTGSGPMPAYLAARTVVLVVSEFGRRIGENGTASGAGTDHGAAAPVFVIGPSGALAPGLHGDHPKVGTTKLPADNLEMTTDLRRVYQAVLERWLRDPDPAFGKRYPALPGLFR